jgi:hypothetical protein
MFWRLFGSDQKVEEALAQSGEGIDICPQTLQLPANNDTPQETAPAQKNGKPALTLWTDYKYTQEEADIKIEEYWASVAANRNR